MATLGPKTGTPAQYLSDLASEMIANGGWEEGDSYVTNDQSDDKWHNNGRCLYHSNIGVYIIIASTAANNENNDNVPGFSWSISTDWDTTNHKPAGKTTAATNDTNSSRNAWEQNVGNDIDDSHNHRDADGSYRTPKHSWLSYQNFDNGRAQWMSQPDPQRHVTYTICTMSNRVVTTAYSNHSSRGSAGIAALEWLDNKLWSDGRTPYHLTTYREAQSDCMAHSHQFNFFYSNNGRPEWRPMRHIDYYSDRNESHYGLINPAPDDDSFFFTYPLLDDASSPRRPTAHFKSIIANDPQRGANHGDTVTENGNTFRFFKTAGGSRNNLMSFGYRWE